MPSALPPLADLEVWFLTGSQHLYGPEALDQVAHHAEQVCRGLDADSQIPLRVVFQPILTRPEEINATLMAASQASQCVGVIAWMHTFSPARMWIGGLQSLTKPLLHLHTQFGRQLPWSTIDMDFMNLHQSAHGDREFGYLCTRMQLPRKVVVGHWQDDQVRREIGVWSRVAAARHDLRTARIARLGDNMREVAVTEGDKLAAQQQFGVAVDGYGVGTLAERVIEVSEREVSDLCTVYDQTYELAPELQTQGASRESLAEAARIEIALRGLLASGPFVGFTDTFEDLHGLRQLPGIAVQRLMADGYGFGAEGDWKAAMLVRAAKVMASGIAGGTSFMEDYTYDLTPGGEQVLGAHMLEICPSIADGPVRCEIHPLGIGGKEPPVRLVFDAAVRPAVNASLVDLGDRFRLITSEVEGVAPPEPLARLPVARALWRPLPDFKTAATAWIYAGGSHHTAYSQALTGDHWRDFAEMSGVEMVEIDGSTELRALRTSMGGI